MDFGNSNFLTVWALKRPILHNCAKFCEDLSIPCCDIAIYVVFQDDDRRHLGFRKIRNFNGLSPIGGQSTSSCQISSKSVKRLRRYGDLTVFKMAAVRHLGFWKFKFLTKRQLRDPSCIIMPNFVKMGQTVEEISRFL